MKGKHQIVVLVSIVVVTTIVWLFNRRDLSDIVTDNFHGVKRLQINDDYLVETSASHFALASPQLTEQTGWKVVSVNGNKVEAYSTKCRRFNSTLNDEQQAAVTEIKRHLYKVDSADVTDNKIVNGGRVNIQLGDFARLAGNVVSNIAKGKGWNSDFQLMQRHASLRYSLETGWARGMSMSNMPYNRHIGGKTEIIKLGANSASYKSFELPTGMVLLFVDEDVATFVYENGHVEAKPIECLGEQKSQLIRQVRGDLKAVEMQAQREQEEERLESRREWEEERDEEDDIDN